jgi:predicted RNA methylase
MSTTKCFQGVYLIHNPPFGEKDENSKLTNPDTVTIEGAFETLDSYNTKQSGGKEDEEDDVDEQGRGAFEGVQDSLW